jgi:hypothetical protein
VSHDHQEQPDLFDIAIACGEHDCPRHGVKKNDGSVHCLKCERYAPPRVKHPTSFQKDSRVSGVSCRATFPDHNGDSKCVSNKQ